MGKYLRKRKDAAELATVDVGPLTRAKKAALLAAAEFPVAGGKKRKLASSAAAATGGELGEQGSLSFRNEVAASEDDRCRNRSREATPSAANSALRNSPAAKAAGMPTAEEMDAFFSAAEKRERARFADKYNFDVEKETPLEGGRYEWILPM